MKKLSFLIMAFLFALSCFAQKIQDLPAATGKCSGCQTAVTQASQTKRYSLDSLAQKHYVDSLFAAGGGGGAPTGTAGGDLAGTYPNPTIKTVNSNIGAFNNVTINAKGQATAGSNIAYISSLSAVGSTPNSNGGSLSNSGYFSTLTLQPANASFPGLLTAADWTTFNNKQAALVSGTNIKTVNGTSLLGSGNITTPAGTVTSVGANGPINSSGGNTPLISADTARHHTGLSTYDQHLEDSIQIAANIAAITGKQATLSSGANIKTINGSSVLGSGNLTISGGGSGTDSASYHTITPMPDSTGFILHKPNGGADTVLVNLGPGAGSYVGMQSSGPNGLVVSVLFQSGNGTTGNPPDAIGAFTGLNLSDGAAPSYGGIIGSDQSGNFFTRASNGTIWSKVITDNNISSYIPSAAVPIASIGNLNTITTTTPTAFQGGGTGNPPGAIGQIDGMVLPNSGAASYGGLLAFDQEGTGWIRKINGAATWGKILTDQNISSSALTVSNGLGYASQGDANAYAAQGMYYNTGSNIPSGATGFTGIYYPYAGITGYGNQMGFERYGKLYVRNQGGGSWGAWKTIPAYLENTATFDPPSIAAGTSTTTTVALTGALMGDIAQASFSLSLTGVMVTAYVSASDVITVVFFNPTGSAVDLASGTLKVRAQ